MAGIYAYFHYMGNIIKNCVVNSLPNSVVHAKSTDIFKTRLDKFLSKQYIIYNYHNEIQGTGRLSVIY